MLPGHMTLDIEPDSGSITLSSGAFAELTAMPWRVPEPAAPHGERPETTESVAAEPAEGIEDGG